MNNEDFQKWAEFYFKEAQQKGQEKFHLWKDTDFQAEIEGLTTKERHFLINQTLLSLKSWYKNNVKNKALFDVINMPESELLKEWVNAVEFLNSVEGKIHNLTREPKEIPGNSEFNKWILTPGRFEQKLDLHGYDAEFWENLSPSAISCWTIALSECYKVKFCLEYLENLLSNNQKPAKHEFSPEMFAVVKSALERLELITSSGKYTGKFTHLKALYNVLVIRRYILGIKNPEENFATWFQEHFGFQITDRALRNPPNKGQQEEERDFKALIPENK